MNESASDHWPDPIKCPECHAWVRPHMQWSFESFNREPTCQHCGYQAEEWPEMEVDLSDA